MLYEHLPFFIILDSTRKSRAVLMLCIVLFTRANYKMKTFFYNQFYPCCMHKCNSKFCLFDKRLLPTLPLRCFLSFLSVYAIAELLVIAGEDSPTASRMSSPISCRDACEIVSSRPTLSLPYLSCQAQSTVNRLLLPTYGS